MGNKPSSSQEDEQQQSTLNSASFDDSSGYPWPKSFFLEARDLSAVSFLVYSFSYILETARRKSGLQGLDLVTSSSNSADEKEKPGQVHKPTSTTIRSHQHLARSFTPAEVIQLIQDNADVLAETFPSEFKDPTAVLESLQLLQGRVDAANNHKKERPLELVEFDDKHQQHELVYAVCKDSINKRITVVFRGSDAELTFASNWTTNLQISKRKVPLPAYLENRTLQLLDTDDSSSLNPPKELYLHSGFYKYLFETTFDDADDSTLRKYDEIIQDVRHQLQQNPGYKLYLTGHSLGGALANMIAFFVACDDTFPKPVTCITAAAPRIGDWNYMYAAQVLEQNYQLRYCRIINDKDLIPLMPFVGYSHAGFQVRLFRDSSNRTPEVTYPRLQDDWFFRWNRTWANSIVANMNIAYDHGDYRERVDENQAGLEQLDLNALYRQENMTGWKLLAHE